MPPIEGNSPPVVQPPTTTPPTEPPPTLPVDPPDPLEPPDGVIPPEPVPSGCGVPFLTVVAYEQVAIDALAGCEELYGLRVSGPLDLRPLASLRRVGEGGLELESVDSLEGLQALEQASRLLVWGGAVQSLLPLAGLRQLGGLRLMYSSVVDLSGLESASGIRSLDVQNNVLLESLQGLIVEPEMTDVWLQYNGSLRDITSLAGLEGTSTFFVMDNVLLTQVPDFERLVRLDVLNWARNGNLLAAPQFPLLTAISDLTVVDHLQLESLTGFRALETANYVWISGNRSLVDVDLGQLRQAATLVIVDNPPLDGTALASSLAGVESQFHRVAPDQTGPYLDPCPWTSDQTCDDSWLCALGTDPACF